MSYSPPLCLILLTCKMEGITPSNSGIVVRVNKIYIYKLLGNKTLQTVAHSHDQLLPSLLTLELEEASEEVKSKRLEWKKLWKRCELRRCFVILSTATTTQCSKSQRQQIKSLNLFISKKFSSSLFGAIIRGNTSLIFIILKLLGFINKTTMKDHSISKRMANVEKNRQCQALRRVWSEQNWRIQTVVM